MVPFQQKEEIPLIEIEHLTKRYGEHTAVSDLSFTVESGGIYGFLGPNGVGKSTTMNIMTSYLSATEGRVKIGGYDVFEQLDKAKRLIGYLPEQPPLYMSETSEEYLRFVGEAKGLRGTELAGQIEEVIRQTKLAEVERRRISALSKGYSSGWALPRLCWAIPPSSSWTSRRWAWTPFRSLRSGT